MLKTINVTLGALVAFSVWMAVVFLGILVAAAVMKIFMIGGSAVYHLMHS